MAVLSHAGGDGGFDIGVFDFTAFAVTSPATEPITLTEAKAHLRVDADDENSLIESLIIAARTHVEAFTHRALVTQVWDIKADLFPPMSLPILFPLAPLLTSQAPVVTYTDTGGTSQTWSSALYTVDAPSGNYARRGRIFLNYNEVYPQTRAIENAVSIRFACGYGAASAVPDAIKTAMKFLVGHWYGNREAVNVGNIVTPMPLAVQSILWPFKSF